MSMAVVTGDHAVQDEVLEDLAEAVNYRRWLCELALPYLGGDALEVGSGLGHYAATWQQLGARVTASEGSPARVEVLRARLGPAGIPVRPLLVPVTETAQFSALVAYNVLEHIPDDLGAVRSLAGLVRPGGAVVLFVPAFMFAFSALDARIGHQRRYRKRDVERLCRTAGLTVERLHYVNSLGLLAWFVGMRLLRLSPQSGPFLKLWDSYVIPLLRRIESRFRPPFGQSVFVVARTPG